MHWLRKQSRWMVKELFYCILRVRSSFRPWAADTHGTVKPKTNSAGRLENPSGSDRDIIPIASVRAGGGMPGCQYFIKVDSVRVVEFVLGPPSCATATAGRAAAHAIQIARGGTSVVLDPRLLARADTASSDTPSSVS
jgi:hypothetical protein